LTQGHAAPGDVMVLQQLADQPPGGGGAEAHQLDRQRKRTQRRHLLGGVGNHHHPGRRRGDDLLLQQRPAAALDQVQARVEFVGPVDGQVEPAGLVQRGQGNAQRFGLRPGLAGGRNARDPQTLGAHPLGQQIDEPTRGRAGAEAQGHAVLDEFQRPGGGGALAPFGGRQIIGHGGLPAGGWTGSRGNRPHDSDAAASRQPGQVSRSGDLASPV